MYRLSVLYFCWIQFWKLPETEHTRRVNTEKHLRRVHQIKLAWIVMLCGLLVIPQLAFVIFSLLFMTFVSFMFLDEA